MPKKHAFLESYNRLPINKKFITALIAISIIPVFLLQLFSFFVTNYYTRNRIYDFANLHLNQTAQAIDHLIERYQSIAVDIQNTESILNDLNNMNVWSNNYQVSVFNIRKKIQSIIFAESGILGMTILTPHGAIANFDSVSNSTLDNFLLDPEEIKRSSFWSQLQHTDKLIIGDSRFIQDPVFGRASVIYAGKRLIDNRDTKKRTVATLIISIDEIYLKKLYSEAYNDEWSFSYLIDQNGKIISFPNEEMIGMDIYTDLDENLSLEEAAAAFSRRQAEWRQQTYTKTKPLSVHNCILVQTLDASYLFGGLRFSLLSIILLGIVAIGFAILIILYTSKNIKVRMETILNSMRLANQRHLNVSVQLNGEDEFAEIGRGFNQMIREMQVLISRENIALNKQRVAELSALEAQINPHFLYNTLDAINWIAISHGEHEISDMLKNLALILRYSIHNSSKIVTIAEDLRYLRKYIYLQQKRYHDQFSCRLLVDDNALQVKIHKLLIQPIIENALIHAFPGKTGNDEIVIDIRLTSPHQLLIRITDNGVGMEKGLVEEINRYQDAPDRPSASIGLRNVIARIKLYYGSACIFDLDSIPGKGTEIRMILPVEPFEEDGRSL